MTTYIECKGGEGRNSSNCKDLQSEYKLPLDGDLNQKLGYLTFREGVVDGLARALGRTTVASASS